MKYVFRPMKINDIPVVHEIEKSLFPDPWPAVSFISEINNETTSFPFVLEDEKNLIGYIICWYYHHELHIGNLAVRKPDQGKGAGRYLLEEIFRYFNEFKTAYLEVRETNRIAIHLYQQFGFQIAYKRKNYYRNGENALVMIKISEN